MPVTVPEFEKLRNRINRILGVNNSGVISPTGSVTVSPSGSVTIAPASGNITLTASPPTGNIYINPGYDPTSPSPRGGVFFNYLLQKDSAYDGFYTYTNADGMTFSPANSFTMKAKTISSSYGINAPSCSYLGLYASRTLLNVDPSSGVVGINTNSPDGAYYLHVNGNAKITDNLVMETANIVFSNGYGLDFSSAASANSTESTLDSYEEGSYTVTTGSDAGFPWTPVGATNEIFGRYVKTGKHVTVKIRMTKSNLDFAPGAWVSLPFTPQQYYTAAIAVTVPNNFTDGGQDIIPCIVDRQTSRIYLIRENSTNGALGITIAASYIIE